MFVSCFAAGSAASVRWIKPGGQRAGRCAGNVADVPLRLCQRRVLACAAAKESALKRVELSDQEDANVNTGQTALWNTTREVCLRARNAIDRRDEYLWRPKASDVDRISRGQASQERGVGSRAVPHRLNQEERQAYDLATRLPPLSNFLAVRGSGYRKERKGAPLVNIHRQWCHAQAIPVLRIHKSAAPGSSGNDALILDLSTLLLTEQETAMLQILFAHCVPSAHPECTAVERLYDEGDFVDEIDGQLSRSHDPQSLEKLITSALAYDWKVGDELVQGGAREIAPIWERPAAGACFKLPRSVAKDAAKDIAACWTGTV